MAQDKRDIGSLFFHARQLSLVALFIGVFWLPGSAPQASAKDLVSFRISGGGLLVDPYKPPPTTDEPQVGGALGYALHLGTFQAELAKAGFKFNSFVAFQRTAAALLALTSGQVEVATTGDSPAVLSRARGDHTREIVVSDPAEASWIIGRKDGPSTLAELSGHRVAVLFGSTMSFQLQSAIDILGLKDVTLTQLTTAAALPALLTGDIDAYAVPAATAELWRRQNGDKLKTVGKLDEADPTLKGVTVVTVREDFLKQNPTFPAAYWAAFKTGLDAIRADPEKYYQWDAGRTGIPEDIVKLTNPVPYGDGPISPDGVAVLKRILAFRLKTGEANGSFAVDDWVVSPGTAAQ